MWFVLLALGCPQGLVCDELGTPTIQLGQGEDAFGALEPLGTMHLEAGPQGGVHAWGAARTTGIYRGRPNLVADDEGPSVLAELLMDGGARASDIYNGALRRNGSSYEIFGLQLILPPAATGDAVYRVEMTDVCGTTVDAEMDVVLPVANKEGTP